MKRKILTSILVCIALFMIHSIFVQEVQAAEYYNSEISYEEKSDGTIKVVAAGTYIENASIPSTINGKKVTEVTDFNDCIYLKKVTIPSTVTKIGYGAFEGCKALTSINIPSSVTEIAYGAFENCSSLKTITIPSSVTQLARATFKGCTSLEKVTLSNKLVTINAEVFSNCASLKSITIPSSVKTIGTAAFSGCTSITSITIPETVTELLGDWGTGIFEGCTSLKTANILAKESTLPTNLFSGCTSLTSVSLSSTFTDAQRGVFQDCTSLKTITLPSKLTIISNRMFQGCTSLTTVNIPDSVESIGTYAFNKCKSLTTITIPCGVKTIGAGWWSYSFEGCDSLKTIYFSKTIQDIDEKAFNNIPTSQLTIYGYAGTAAKVFAQENGYKFVECTPVSSIKITGSNSVLKTKNITLKANVSPTNAFNKSVTWTSSNTKVATVSSTGVVTGKGSGTATITATARDGSAVKGSYTVTVKLTELPFKDVTVDDWFYNAVKYNYEKGMIKGTTNTTFAPYGNLTRGMLVTILWRMEGNPKATSNQFKDVGSNQYYYDAVNWAASKKIVNGYGNGKFGPNDEIIREQLAVMLRNYADYKKKDVSARTDLSKFKDSAKISGYAKDAVSWAVAKKIISGKSGGTNVDPHGKATRAEAASMLYSYCMNVK